MQQTVKEKIRQRRKQMLVHSYIYYELNDNIISDSQWSKWAKELAQLQKDYPKESAEVEEYENFKNWDGSTGAFLKFGENIKTVAHILLENQSKPVKTAGLISHSEKKSQKGKLKSETRRLF